MENLLYSYEQLEKLDGYKQVVGINTNGKSTAILSVFYDIRYFALSIIGPADLTKTITEYH